MHRGCERDHVPKHAVTDEQLVFLSTTGTPIDPKNFVRTFHDIRQRAGLPRITVHHTRHTAATMLKNLGVPARDAQLILGHSHVTTTQQLYQHADLKGQTQALELVEKQLLTAAVAVKTAVNLEFSTGESTIFRALTPGGPGGARTLDTLLKSLVLTADSSHPTPVIRHLRTRADAHILGWVAVDYCCQSDSLTGRDDTLVFDWVVILNALRRFEAQVMAAHSFPLNLLPARPLPGATVPGGTRRPEEEDDVSAKGEAA